MLREFNFPGRFCKYGLKSKNLPYYAFDAASIKKYVE